MVERRQAMPGANCLECPMRQRNEWRVLAEEDVKLLAQARKTRRYRAGETIFSAGEPSYGIYCIVAGATAMRRIDAEGNTVLIQISYPGDTLGYRGLLLGEKRRFSAEALGPSRVCFIDQQVVKMLMERNPALGLQFLRRINTDLDDAHNKLVQNATLSNRSKFVHLLVNLMNRHGRSAPDGSHVINLPISRRDMASMIGARHETLSRIISRLEEDGVARFSGRTVCVNRPHSLMEEIHC
jgi:CRP/FNR family transcriptional regulator